MLKHSSGTSGQGSAVIAIQNISKVYAMYKRPSDRLVEVATGRQRHHDFHALEDVTLQVNAGEMLALIGPNGSGKSTTVKMLLGLLYPTKGHIEVFGNSPRHVPTKARIGYLPEESYLYRYLNSRETLDFFGNLFHLDKGDRDKRAEQLLEMVGLNQTRTRSVGEFSKGMQRRIGLAQALINDPDLIILDEPTAGLDPIGCREIKDLIIALAKRGKTVILSSHLLSDVEDVCDRVVIYYGGKIQALGTLKELLAKPDTLRITTPVLPRPTMERVLEIIRKDIGSGEVRVDNPTQNLESYFLEVVEKAKQAAQQTSGAQSGARVAEYLRGDVTSTPAPDKVLEKLTLPTAATPAPVAAASAAPAVNEKKLDALTKAEPVPTPIQSIATASEKAADLAQADEKLSSLLGKKK